MENQNDLDWNKIVFKSRLAQYFGYYDFRPLRKLITQNEGLYNDLISEGWHIGIKRHYFTPREAAIIRKYISQVGD